MKKLLIGVLTSLLLVGCGGPNAEALKEEMQNQELTKEEKREMLNEYLEDKKEDNVEMVEKYLDDKISKEEFDSYFLEQYEITELYKDNLELEDYTSDETVMYALYGTHCKGITNRDKENDPRDFYEFDLERLERTFDLAKIYDDEEVLAEYYGWDE